MKATTHRAVSVLISAPVISLLAVSAWRLKAGTTSQPEPRRAPLEAKLIPGSTLPRLGPAGEYRPRGDVVDVEISEWPGYAALIVANRGLAPSEDSYFFRRHGFKLNITVSEAEAEGWERIQSGKIGVSVTTADVLALYARQLEVKVPLQLGFSRGADGIITLAELTSINQLRGKVLAVPQYTEAEFFLRFLAGEAGLEVAALPGLDAAPDPERINVVYTATAFDAADVFAEAVRKADPRIAGAVTWSPRTIELPKELPGRVRLLASNRNLLIIADVLIVNAAFAKNRPQLVRGLVEGILHGVEELRADPRRHLPIVARAFQLGQGEAETLLSEVHLSNHAENQIFFAERPGMIGNFRELYYSAAYAYGKQVLAPEKLIDATHLEALKTEFAGQTIGLAPVKSAEKVEALERNPLLTKQIRFRFAPNSAELDLQDSDNRRALDELGKLLRLSPGSFLHLRGHLDDGNREEFRRRGEGFFRRQAVRAIEHSKLRAESVKTALIAEYRADPARLDTEGRGWDEPLPGKQPDENRRVEAQLFTLE